MLTPQEVAVQLDRAISDANANLDKHGQGIEAILNSIRDPNAEEVNNHLEMLLRLPKIFDAIQYIKQGSREFLKGFLEEVPEFDHIFERL